MSSWCEDFQFPSFPHKTTSRRRRNLASSAKCCKCNTGYPASQHSITQSVCLSLYLKPFPLLVIWWWMEGKIDKQNCSWSPSMTTDILHILLGGSFRPSSYGYLFITVTQRTHALRVSGASGWLRSNWDHAQTQHHHQPVVDKNPVGVREMNNRTPTWGRWKNGKTSIAGERFHWIEIFQPRMAKEKFVVIYRDMVLVNFFSNLIWWLL